MAEEQEQEYENKRIRMQEWACGQQAAGYNDILTLSHWSVVFTYNFVLNKFNFSDTQSAAIVAAALVLWWWLQSLKQARR